MGISQFLLLNVISVARDPRGIEDREIAKDKEKLLCAGSIENITKEGT